VTLILTVLTHSYVAQVSDRRLMTTGGGQIEENDDEQNKAVLWCGRLAFAYSGFADLGPEGRTDLWLARTLSDIATSDQPPEAPPPEQRNQNFMLAQLALRATDEFLTPRIQNLAEAVRRQTFVAVGWARFGDEPDFSPYLGLVSNMHAPDGQPLETPDPQFAFLYRRLEPSEAGHFASFGQTFDSAEEAAMIQQLGALDSAFPGPDAIIQALVDKMREKAAENSLVGPGMLINVLPRAAIRPGQEEHTALLGPPTPDQQTFLYVPSDPDAPWVAYGPVVTCGGMIMSGFTVSPISPEAD